LKAGTDVRNLTHRNEPQRHTSTALTFNGMCAWTAVPADLRGRLRTARLQILRAGCTFRTMTLLPLPSSIISSTCRGEPPSQIHPHPSHGWARRCRPQIRVYLSARRFLDARSASKPFTAYVCCRPKAAARSRACIIGGVVSPLPKLCQVQRDTSGSYAPT
jgi:hypothetical protein